MVSAILKLFSSTSFTRKCYRSVGNILGSWHHKRTGIRGHYVERSKLWFNLLEERHIVQNNSRLLEVGPGSAHWDAIFTKLLYDVEISLYDVWDCRQLEAIKYNATVLEKLIDDMANIAPTRREQSHGLLRTISRVKSFEDLYRLLDFEYIVDQRGCLTGFSAASYDVVYSFNVLEHVKEGAILEFTKNLYRLLKPGGYSIHQIDLCDHLAYYHRSLLPKNYLRYSDKCWKRCFQNEVQYFNRLQRSEWLNIFQDTGLELVEEQSEFSEIGDFALSSRFRHLEKHDLECTTLTLIHRKPY